MGALRLTANQYRAALAKLGLTQVGAAKLFGVADKTSQRWAAAGLNTQTVAILLRLMVAGKITIDDVKRARKKHR